MARRGRTIDDRVMAGAMRFVRFGAFEADLDTCELRRAGQRVELQELPFRILAALLERPGELVSRDDLRASAWPAGVHVDFEHGLNKAVNKIRVALGDDPERPRYVETLPRRGYRFIAPVELPREYEKAQPGTPRGAFRILWDGRTIPLAQGENVLGRELDAAVWVDSSTVSRRHARIVVTGERAVLEDLASKNGTFLRGRRITARESLVDGDEIAVGSARMTFRASSAGQSTKTGSSGD
jgi:DNA-binding winged helix-turn-helix (wHTH) protein